MGQMQTISIRIPDEDFQWLLSQHETTGRTPSEKLRALLSRVRQQEAGMVNPESCSAWMRDMTRPFMEGVAALERKHKLHSDVIAAVAEWIPQIMASLVSSHLGGKRAQEDAIEVEAILAQQSCRLISALLRTAVTSVPATYDKGVLDQHLPDILEIASIISTRKGKEPKNG